MKARAINHSFTVYKMRSIQNVLHVTVHQRLIQKSKNSVDCLLHKHSDWTVLLCVVLGEDRGPVLEVIVSRTNFISSHTSKSVRVVGLSTALANARDLADWLGIGQVRRPSWHQNILLEISEHGLKMLRQCIPVTF